MTCKLAIKETVIKFLENFVLYIYEKAKISDVNLVFNRNHPDSIEGLARMNRDTIANRVYNFLLDMQLHFWDVVLKVTKNKEQLTELIVNKIKTVVVNIMNTVTG